MFIRDLLRFDAGFDGNYVDIHMSLNTVNENDHWYNDLVLIAKSHKNC